MSKKVTHTSFQNTFNGNTSKQKPSTPIRATASPTWSLTANLIRHGTPWSHTDDTNLSQLAGKYTAVIIGKTLDRTVESVKWRAKQLGISLRVNKALAKPMVKTAAVIQQQTSWPFPLQKPAIKIAVRSSWRPVPTKPQNHNTRWSEAQDQKLVQAFKDGTAPSSIANLLNRTISSVASRLHVLKCLTFDKTNKQFKTVPTVWLTV